MKNDIQVPKRWVALALAATTFLLGNPRTEAQVLTLESLESTALDEHPLLGRRRAELQVAGARVDAVRAEMRPSLYLDVSVAGAPGMQAVSVQSRDRLAWIMHSVSKCSMVSSDASSPRSSITL